MCDLVIDHREHALLKAFEDAKIEVQVKALDIGDVHILVNGTVSFVIERKTVADLESSIKDGRYSEQKARASASASSDGGVFLYVLEGSASFSFEDASTRSKMLTSAVLNTVFRDKHAFIFTKDVKETMRFLMCMASRAPKYETEPPKSYETCLALQQSVSSKKKENIDKSRCFIHQLCCIPGISIKKAESIVSTHQVETMSGFVEKMKEQPHAVKFFKDTPGIGNVLAKQIYEYCGL